MMKLYFEFAITDDKKLERSFFLQPFIGIQRSIVQELMEKLGADCSDLSTNMKFGTGVA